MSRTLVVDRHRVILRASGRDPVKMLDGLATAAVADPPAGRAVYTAFLTAKGRMVADARVILLKDGAPAERELLLETDPAAAPALQEHFRKFVPPLFARFEDVSDAWGVIGVHGAAAAAVVAEAVRVVLGEPPDAAGSEPAPPRADEGALTRLAVGGFAIGTEYTGAPGLDLLLPGDRVDAVRDALLEVGAVAGGEEELERRRVRAGRPRWGAELTEDVIPLEAGLLDRAISQTKGCYTGQEVIVRILHRGHVNRHLRRLRFEEDGPGREAPAPGADLYEEGGTKVRGTVTSVAGDAGLGYVRREIEPPAELRLGAPDGPPVRVEALEAG